MKPVAFLGRVLLALTVELVLPMVASQLATRAVRQPLAVLTIVASAQ